MRDRFRTIFVYAVGVGGLLGALLCVAAWLDMNWYHHSFAFDVLGFDGLLETVRGNGYVLVDLGEWPSHPLRIHQFERLPHRGGHTIRMYELGMNGMCGEARWLGFGGRYDPDLKWITFRFPIWFPLCLSAGCILLWAFLIIQRWRLPGHACPACGYDLRGNPDAAACPECGHELASA